MNLWKRLNRTEADEFRQWARDNFQPDTRPNATWHPVVREEWAKLQE